MPFPDLTASGFTAVEDSQYLQETPISAAQSYTTQGGLFISRRKFTRSPGTLITTGFSMISESDKLLFDKFFANCGFGSDSVSYTHPVSGATMEVFIYDQTPYTTQYKGWGSSRLWNITDIKLRSNS